MFVAEGPSLAPLPGIREWVEVVLPYTAGIRMWASFWERYGRSPAAGESFDFLSSCSCSIMFLLSLSLFF